MKYFSKALATAAVLAFTQSLYAQAVASTSASAAASATIITPIALVKNVDMNFGNIAVSQAVPGKIVLAPTGTRTSSGVNLPNSAGTAEGANFTVSGQASYTYSITLPGSDTLTSGNHTITVNAFTSNPAIMGILNKSGTQHLKVGATLNLIAAQASGSYTSVKDDDKIIVNYN
jgi:hypothetical protein